jgi:hypothetical protein
MMALLYLVVLHVLPKMKSSYFTPSPIKLMNLKIVEFLNDLEHILCDLPDYLAFTQSVRFMSSVDESAVQRSFNEYICVPYGNYISNEDEVFFIESVSTESGENVVNNNHPSAIDFDLVRIIKKKWMTLSSGDKNAIWSHLKLLMLLNERCIHS